MTKDFFESVMRLPTYSGKEGMVVDFIQRWARGNRCRFRRDSAGNVYLTKGSAEYKAVMSGHLDSVHKDQEEMVEKGAAKELEWKGDELTAKNPITGKRTGLGADDLCGVAVSLAVLGQLPSGKAVFTVKEELGCVGAKAVDKSFFDDASFVVGTDSPESNRATRYSDGVLLCGDEFFEKFVKPVCAAHGVTSFRSEPLCDCSVYRKIDLGGGKRIECFNVGSGGHDPHKETEYAKFSEVQNAEELVLDLCRTVPSDRRWESDYKEEERPKWEPYSRLGVYSAWRRGGSSYWDVPKQAEFDFAGSPSDREFVWKFRNGEAAANLYARRVGGILSPHVRIEREGADSVRVTGPENRLMAAFRFAYNYDNGTSFMDWEQFEKAVPRAREEFERALARRDPAADDGDDLPPSPMERSDSELCSLDLTFSDPHDAPKFVKALRDKGIDADPDDDGFGEVSLYGTLGDVKRAYVEWWNVEENASYGSWGEFAKAEPMYANAFFDDVEFMGGGEDDAIDAEFTEISENGEWLSRYYSGRPL